MPYRALAAILLTSSIAGAQDDLAIPDAAKAFVAAGTRPLAYEVADLNRDGRPDAILVVEAEKDDPESDGRPRTLLILAGHQADGTFREAARNAKIVYCSGAAG